MIDDKTRAHQAVRLRRLWMTIGSYCFTFAVVTLSSVMGLVAPIQVVAFVVLTSVVNALFYYAFRSNWNLRRRDPNLTAEQMALSLIPAYWVIYFVHDSQVRTAFLLIALVPLLYGILGLDTRKFIAIGLLNFFMYVGLVMTLWHLRPADVNMHSELIVMGALLATMAQISLIGGYISGMREKLREKNNELNQALAKICEMANQDELTGVSNRRFLLQAIEQEYSRCKRGAEPFSLCIMDIDYFKRINDGYGHLAGDEVLRKVAARIRDHVRLIDCFGRYGGEEFLLIMPQTPLKGAVHKADNLRKIVEQLRVPEVSPDLCITLSIGVTQYHEGESLMATIARADQALYLAKERGRNRVICAEDEQSIAVPASE